MTQDRLTLLSGYKYMKLEGRKHPDHTGDSYKRLSVNWMPAGSRLLISPHSRIFFKHVFSQHL